MEYMYIYQRMHMWKSLMEGRGGNVMDNERINDGRWWLGDGRKGH